MGNSTSKHANDYKILGTDVLARFRTLTGFQDDEILAEHKKFFSIARDGRLKKSQMETLFSDHLPATKHRHLKYLTRCIFSAIDRNGDGYIDFNEYLMSLKFFGVQSPVEKANFIFRIIDENGDNRVTKKELQHLLKCLQEYHKSLSNAQVSDITAHGPEPATDMLFENLDTDKSGFIGVSEFVDGWLKNETVRTLFSF